MENYQDQSNMSNVTVEKTLPPNVKGKSRGNVELKIHEIRWKSPNLLITNHHYSSGSIEARIIWWGDNLQSAAILKLNFRKATEQITNIIKYNILTSPRLFSEYIKTCEPIEIKLTTAISNIQLGTCYIPIPQKIIRLLSDKNCGFTAYQKATYQIFNPKNKNIGYMVVGIEINMSAQTTRRAAPLITPLALNDKALSNKPALRTHKNRQDIQKEDDSILSSKSTMKQQPSTNTLNYLTGRHMTKDQESEALNTLKEISPTNSFIEQLHEDILKMETCPRTRRQLEKVDSVKINILHLSLKPAGVREVMHKIPNLNNQFGIPVFMIECKVNALLSLLCHHRMVKDNNLPDFDTFKTNRKIPCRNLASRIDFNSESIHPIRVPNMKSPLHCLHFKVWCHEDYMYDAIELGSTSLSIHTVMETTNFTLLQNCPIISPTGNIVVATLTVKVQLGCHGLHFGVDFLNAIAYNNKENLSNVKYQILKDVHRSHIDNQMEFKTGCECKCKLLKHNTCPLIITCNHDEQQDQKNFNEESPSSSSSVKNNKSDENQPNNKNYHGKNNDGCISVERSLNTSATTTLLYGLIYLGAINHFKKLAQNVGTFMVCRSFWKTHASATNICEQNAFDYLEVFPVVCDPEFFNRTRNQYLYLEMWQKTNDDPEQMIGTTSLPLHQFHVAFKDKSVIDYLSKVKLPVISIDGWTNIVSPLTSCPVAKLQVILAIGTEEQLEYLKTTRGLTMEHCGQKCRSNKIVDTSDHIPSINNAETQTNFTISHSVREIQANLIDDTGLNIETTHAPTPIPQLCTTNTVDNHRQALLADMLNNFIDNLASHLPSTRSAETTSNDAVTPLPVSQNLTTQQQQASQLSNIQIRRTSDLLDALQRALMCPPTTGQQTEVSSISVPTVSTNVDTFSPAVDDCGKESQAIVINEALNQSINVHHQINANPTIDTTDKIPRKNTYFQVLIEIENALHIPKILIRVNKKCGKQRNRCNSSKQQYQQHQAAYRGVNEIEPSTYATFEANGPPTNIVHSHEGPVYTTNVVEKCCNPQWNKRFEVQLPIDLMTNDEKRFIIKIWRKASTDFPQARLLPNPMEDAIVGFTAIDLSVLLLGMPTISGWYNIVDFSGRINGQIKINIQPIEDLQKYHQQYATIYSTKTSIALPKSSGLLHCPSQTMGPLTIDIGIADITNISDNCILSRTLKRKFTELEEITQRLKARLFDVTGDDEYIDADDEFENDLNTHPDEDDEIVKLHEANNNNSDFDWLRSDVNIYNNSTTTNVWSPDNENMPIIQLVDNRKKLQPPQGNSAFNCLTEANTKLYTTQNTTQFVELGRNSIGCLQPSIQEGDQKQQQQHQSQQPILNLENIIKQHEIDEIINPNLIRKLLDPIHKTSSDESTSHLVDPLATRQCATIEHSDDDGIYSDVAASARAIGNDISDVGTSSSSLDQDRIRLISNALQRTIIDDRSVTSSGLMLISRETPDGGASIYKTN